MDIKKNKNKKKILIFSGLKDTHTSLYILSKLPPNTSQLIPPIIIIFTSSLTFQERDSFKHEFKAVFSITLGRKNVKSFLHALHL